MNNSKDIFCLVCGHKGFDQKLYADIPSDPIEELKNILPPYKKAWGMPSYDVCDCCGFEFGFDDDPGAGEPGVSFSEYLIDWYKSGAKWFYPEAKPENWSLVKQLKAAGLTVPIGIE